jgi:hypothetical protein
MHSVLPTRLPLKRFYQHFGRLTALALRANPLRIQKIKVPASDFFRAIVGGTKYVFSLYGIYKDYPIAMRRNGTSPHGGKWGSSEHS